MASGGHSRSGPAPTPGSGRSDSRGLSFKNLPAEGYTGDIPDFPLPKMRRTSWEFEDGKRYKVFDEDATASFRETELFHWNWAWRTPQAALWATDQWSWVLPAVADWCRLKALVAEDDAPVGLWAQIRGREGDVLLTSDSLARAGYQVVADEVADKRATAPKKRSGGGDAFRSRLKAVGDEQ